MNLDRAINFLLYLLGMAFNLAVMALVGYAVYFFAMQGITMGNQLAYDLIYTGEDYYMELVLEEDTPAAEVAVMLEEMGIITNHWLYRLELFLMGRIRTYQAGTYILNRSMTNTEVHQVLRGSLVGIAPEETITILEGWTIRDMAAYFEYREFFPAEDFINVAENHHFPFTFLNDVPDRPNRLEGYLFPDTYFVPVNPSPGAIIYRMLRRFDVIFDAQMVDRAYELGYTMDDIVIMASIIERETRLAHERPMVSQVIHNRLDTNMRLQMCSTVAYVLDYRYGIQRDVLYYVDLEIDSPHNTYQNSGLPIGPISSPGQAALRAALWPSGGDYLFFVLVNEQTGEHYFSTTFDAHIAANPRRRQE